MSLPWDNNSWEIAARIVATHRNLAAHMTGESRPETPLVLRLAEAAPILLRAVIIPPARRADGSLIVRGERTDEGTDKGTLVEAVTVLWFDLIDLLIRDPKAAFEISPEKWEEVVAGAYRRAGFDDVILTPRSGDLGRDVIAIKRGIGTVRIIDQVKAYRPPHRVDANDVRALMGVLQTDGAAKGFVTTTSDFAPGIRSDPLIQPLIPSRLDLINGTMLIERLKELAHKSSNDNDTAKSDL